MLIKSNTKIRNSAQAKHLSLSGYVNWALTLCLIAVLFLPAILPFTVSAQELNYPMPLKPDNDSTGVRVNITAFSWKPFFTGTEKYRLEISKNSNMSTPLFSKEVPGTSYSYNEGQLEYNTVYFWRVTATQPMGGDPSPIFKFTTEKSTTTAPPPPTSQSSDSFIDYMVKNPLLPATIAGGIIIIALALYLAIKPKKRPITASPPQGMPPNFTGPIQQSAPAQFSGQPTQGTGLPFTGTAPNSAPPPSSTHQLPGSLCSRCNTPNTPGRKFCNSCGANLVPVPPPPPPQNQGWGSPQIDVCPSCSTVNAPGRKFCSKCGTSMVPADTPPTPPPQPAPEQPRSLNCQTCGTANTPKRKFFSNFGTSLASAAPQQPPQLQSSPPQEAPVQNFQPQSDNVIQEFTCPICGAVIKQGNNPCPSCGTELDWGK
jgi:DNA-directed RNA polymerase subunit M/transcription elongation factor TFIIS